ncbi:MAG: hypothetical protein ACFFBH_09305 [Promethearchaeota archaeon]
MIPEIKEKNLDIDRSSISRIIIPFSKIFYTGKRNDIYSGEEVIQFKNRNPIFKSLMRIEFEDAMKEYLTSLR